MESVGGPCKTKPFCRNMLALRHAVPGPVPVNLALRQIAAEPRRRWVPEVDADNLQEGMGSPV